MTAQRRKPLIKVCGMRDPENIRQISSMGTDLMGFIFYPKSPRYVEPELVKGSVDSLPPGVAKVGVFVNETIDKIRAIARYLSLDMVQLHGDENAAFCADLKSMKLKVIKAFGMSEKLEPSYVNQYADVVDYYLFDTYTPGYGGSGRTFDWSLLNRLSLQRPYFLSGGIGLENIAELLTGVDPLLYAIDINSRIEIEPGMKDVGKFKEIMKMFSEYKNKVVER